MRLMQHSSGWLLHVLSRMSLRCVPIERIARVLKVAGDSEASEGELADALKTARATTFDCHTRCGSEGDWSEQAGYFVARAATAALTPARAKAQWSGLAGSHELQDGADFQVDCKR